MTSFDTHPFTEWIDSETSTSGDQLYELPKFDINKHYQISVQNVKTKTSLCKNYSERGYCPYGYKCRFAHGVQELKFNTGEHTYKTKPCVSFFKKCYCQYGPICNYSHTHTQKHLNFKSFAGQYREIIYGGKNGGESRLMRQILGNKNNTQSLQY